VTVREWWKCSYFGRSEGKKKHWHLLRPNWITQVAWGWLGRDGTPLRHHPLRCAPSLSPTIIFFFFIFYINNTLSQNKW